MSKRGFIRKNWVYKKLNSVKTTLLIIGLMSVTMIIGTIFPQEMSVARYIKSWGVELYESYKSLGLLTIFKSPWFLVLTYLFSLNIIVCTYERYKSMRARSKLKKKTQGQAFVTRGKKAEKITPHNYSDMNGKIHNLIGKNGFKIQKRHASDKLSQLVVVKGISYLLVSIIFHLGIFLCVIGFVQTYLDNYEDYVMIYPNEIKDINTVGRDTRLFKTLEYFKDGLNKYFGFDFDDYVSSKEGLIKLELNEFETEYTWFNDNYYPKDWKSDIVVYNKFNEEVLRKKIEVNDPIYYNGFAFYQSGYDQSCDFHIIRRKQVIKAKPNEPFDVVGEEGKFMIGTIRTGKLFERFKDIPSKITPNLDVYYMPPTEPPKEGEVPKRPKREKVGNLVINKPGRIKDMVMSFNNFKEATGISYKRDAGVPILWFASILLMIAMCMRVYLPYYKLTIQIEPFEEEKTKVIIGGNSIGLTANLQKQINKILEACE
jgi:cytochrome c biogenesis protein